MLNRCKSTLDAIALGHALICEPLAPLRLGHTKNFGTGALNSPGRGEIASFYLYTYVQDLQNTPQNAQIRCRDLRPLCLECSLSRSHSLVWPVPASNSHREESVLASLETELLKRERYGIFWSSLWDLT